MENVTPFGTLSDGREIRRIALTRGDLRADILDYGARLLHLSRGDGPNAAVAAPTIPEMEGRLRYAGPIIGPVINRIAGAEAEIAGKTCRFEANEGPNSLHSGSASTHGLVWEIDEAQPDFTHLTARLEDGAGGFPGTRRIEALYRLTDALELELRAVTDAPTLMNPGHHGVWNPDGAADWQGLTLEIPADNYLPTDADKIPTGEIAPTEGTPFDHRTPRAPDPSLDHNFCFPPGFGLRARLIGQTHTLEIHSDAPGLQAYAGGTEGIALEPQLWPDAPHNPAFPTITLGPGETFTQRTRFVLT